MLDANFAWKANRYFSSIFGVVVIRVNMRLKDIMNTVHAVVQAI